VIIIFFDIKGNVHNEFVLAGQTVNSAYFCGILWRVYENVRRLRPELWRQKNWLLHHDNAPSHIFFLPGKFSLKRTRLSSPTHNIFCLFPRLKTKLKGRHFDTIEVIVTEPQAMNTFTEHDFQDVFKNWLQNWERCISAEGEGGGSQ
jgi:hypothetical protein